MYIARMRANLSVRACCDFKFPVTNTISLFSFFHMQLWHERVIDIYERRQRVKMKNEFFSHEGKKKYHYRIELYFRQFFGAQWKFSWKWSKEFCSCWKIYCFFFVYENLHSAESNLLKIQRHLLILFCD